MAALLGVLVLGESFTVPMAVGFALVLVGSALATRRSHRAASVAATSRPPAREAAATGAPIADEG